MVVVVVVVDVVVVVVTVVDVGLGLMAGLSPRGMVTPKGDRRKILFPRVVPVPSKGDGRWTVAPMVSKFEISNGLMVGDTVGAWEGVVDGWSDGTVVGPLDGSTLGGELGGADGPLEGRVLGN